MIVRSVVVLVFASLIPLAFIAVTRVTPAKVPRISIVPDMDKQQKFLPQSHNPLFADGRGMRYYPAGTVARGEANLDSHLYQGIVNGQWASTFPMSVTPAMMERGQRQYNIYCSPCHGFSGYGDGMVAKRADELALAGTPGMTWVPPKSLQDKDTRDRPLGHIFNTITNGIRTMPPYKGQISVEDRWAIILYVRALQRSQNAQLANVPADQQQALLASQAEAIRAEQEAAAKAAREAAAEAAKKKTAPAKGDAAASAPASGDAAKPAEGQPAEAGVAPAEGAGQPAGQNDGAVAPHSEEAGK